MTAFHPAQFFRLAALGIFVGAFGHSFLLFSVGWSGALLFVVVLVTAAFFRKPHLLAFILGVAAAFLRFDVRLSGLEKDLHLLSGGRMIEAEVRSVDERKRGFFLLFDEISLHDTETSRPVSGAVGVFVSDAKDIQAGERLRFFCTLRPPTPPLIFSDQKVREGIRAMCTDPLVISRTEQRRHLAALLARTRDLLWKSLARALPSPHAELAIGVLVGNRTVSLPDSVRNDFIHTGTSHIVAASGYNISLVALAAGRMLLALRLPRRPRLVLLVAAVWFFVLLAGGEAAVVRAGIMATIALLAKLAGRGSEALSALLIAGALMLIFNPASLLFDVGFELSLAAMFGILVLAPRLRERYPRLFPKTFAGNLFLETTAAILATQPIVFWRFGAIAPVAFLANMLIVPLVPLAMSGAVLTALGSFFHPIFSLLALLPLAAMINAARLLSELPFSFFDVGEFPGWSVPLLYAALGFFFLKIQKRSPENSAGGPDLKDDYDGWAIDVRETRRA